MENARIKVKIGIHEFEAEGPVELVQCQFQAFRDLIESMPRQMSNHEGSVIKQTDESKAENDALPHVPIDKIMHVDGRVVSLTALPASPEDAALLLMLGQREMRNSQSATGQEIGDGLEQSGQPVDRVDRVLDKAIREALVMKIGMGRSTRYRLTNQGLRKALTLARDLIAQLP